MASVILENVCKQFGQVTALDDINIEVEQGEFVALLGPSGCGKSTILRLIAGFEEVSGGQVSIEGRVVSSRDYHEPPEKRRIGMVFQSYALWPHMNVEENVSYPLRFRELKKAEKGEVLARALEATGLEGMRKRRPNELSGGQRQRVALARCLAMSPDIVLLDEPLANLDTHLRESLQEEFRDFHRKTGATMLYVTHDQAEAMSLADRIAVMTAGKIRQLGTPQEIYQRPEDNIVAGFIGNGMTCDVEDIHAETNGSCTATLFGVPVSCRKAAAVEDGTSGTICIRPEGLRLSEGGIPARVDSVTYQGSHYKLLLRPKAAIEQLIALHVPFAPPAPGDMVNFSVTDSWLLPSVKI